jgi:hypothetical protein
MVDPEQNDPTDPEQPASSSAASGTGQGYWLHDAGGPAHFVRSDVKVMDCGGTKSSMVRCLGAGVNEIIVEPLSPGLRLAGFATSQKADEAVNWARHEGHDPVEDRIERRDTAD